MNNKKLGWVIIVIGIIFGIIIISFTNQLFEKSAEIGCLKDPKCKPIESSLSITHFAVGILGFLLALGFYLIFFTKSEEAIIKRLEYDKKENISKERFNLVMSLLDKNEQKVLKAIKEQDGIKQNTLVLRTELSKAKVSQILTNFEKRKLIKKQSEGRTFSVHLLKQL